VRDEENKDVTTEKDLVVVNQRAWMLNNLSVENNHSERRKPHLSPFSFSFILFYRQDLCLSPILTPNTLSMPIISTRKSQFLNLVKEIDA
jgi:hypothetical protein